MCHRLIACLILTLALFACTHKDAAVESLIGTDPQRLSVGTPAEVQSNFIDKVKQCWFAGKSAPLHGYRYEAGEKPAEEGGNFTSPADAYLNLKFFNEGDGAPAFEVQFHKYNENTLIVTRNITLSNDLMGQLKRDIQLWTFKSPACGNI